MEYRKTSHRTFLCTYHLVLVVKYRKPVIDDEIKEHLEKQFSKILENNNGSLIEFNSDKDHIHLLFEIAPDASLANLIRGAKGATSRLVRKEFPEKLKQHLRGDSFWSDSYFLATCGGVIIDTLKQYVETQGKPKRKYEFRNLKYWNKV